MCADISKNAEGVLPGAISDPAQQIKPVLAFLEAIARDRTLLTDLSSEDRAQLIRLAGEIHCADPTKRRLLLRASQRKHRARRVEKDQKLLDETGIRKLRARPVFTTPNIAPPREIEQDQSGDAEPPKRIGEAQNCYVCKRDYTDIHRFYDQLCPECAALNFKKRTELADLRGRVALLTGGRVKIGYQAGIKLLRCGAELIVTTRFPRDSAMRYASEPDFAEWGHRLQIFGLDLRHTPSVEAFCQHLLSARSRLDFIINNACQTVRRPPEFYEHMMARERETLSSLPETCQGVVGPYEGLRGYEMLPDASAQLQRKFESMAGIANAAELSQVRLLPEELAQGNRLFPAGQLDKDLQQVDLRDRNSWRLTLAEVPAVELLEVHLVNAVAPFIFNARLKPLMLRTAEKDKHIVNVSAVEGQFYRKFKTTRHPHTNMAKAALNMMTRTSAADYQADGIHMNSVDTGWVTDEDPVEIAARKTRDHQFHPPLDIVDGAARIVDPIIAGFNTGEHIWGKFLKDYLPVHW